MPPSKHKARALLVIAAGATAALGACGPEELQGVVANFDDAGADAMADAANDVARAPDSSDQQDSSVTPDAGDASDDGTTGDAADGATDAADQ